MIRKLLKYLRIIALKVTHRYIELRKIKKELVSRCTTL